MFNNILINSFRLYFKNGINNRISIIIKKSGFFKGFIFKGFGLFKTNNNSNYLINKINKFKSFS